MISAKRVSSSAGPDILRYKSLELLVAQFPAKGRKIVRSERKPKACAEKAGEKGYQKKKIK